MSTIGVILIGAGSAVVGAIGGFLLCVALVLRLCKDKPQK